MGGWGDVNTLQFIFLTFTCQISYFCTTKADILGDLRYQPLSISAMELLAHIENILSEAKKLLSTNKGKKKKIFILNGKFNSI
jgi:hypothetical protein